MDHYISDCLRRYHLVGITITFVDSTELIHAIPTSKSMSACIGPENRRNAKGSENRGWFRSSKS